MSGNKLILNNRYRLDQELGHGGMGTVYRGYDQLLGREVAVKLLTSENIGTEGRARLLSEARAVAKLNHPNIVSIFDAGEADKTPYIVMEFIQGKTLKKNRPSEIEEIIQITKTVCDALSQAHSHGIIHRDLKPDNIIRTQDGGLKLTDFGLAFSIGSPNESTGSFEGTVQFASPEQALGKEIDGRSDLYSLGVMLYEFFTGKVPFDGSDPLEIISLHVHTPPVPLRKINPSVSIEIENIVLKLLNKDPEDRFQTAQGLLDSLKGFGSKDQNERPTKSLHNIPEDISSFVGRKSEITAIKQMFPQTRLITLTGVGGTGKSRIAYQVAREIILKFRDGVHLFELASVSEGSRVLKTILNGLHISERRGTSTLDMIVEFLAEKEMLLVFDNCEHLIRDCGSAVAGILKRCPGIKVLITSRESLGVIGETTHIVPSMETPAAGILKTLQENWRIESMKLFLDRAKAVKPEFSPNEVETAAAAEICRRVDGMPLAIELAAARVRFIPVEEISARLSENFRLLTGGSRTALPRQQTLRALIDWSYDLLTEDEQVLFKRLAVFSSGWTITAAEEICADESIPKETLLDLLARLVDKSIIYAEGVIGEARYGMLETIRQYALEKLIQSKKIQQFRRNHLAFFHNMVRTISPKLRQADQVRWLDVLERDHDNIRSALDWGISGEGSTESLTVVGSISSSLLQFWMVRGYWIEARSWIEKIRENPEFPAVEKTVQIQILNAAGKIISEMGDIHKAEEICHQALLSSREVRYKKGEAYALLGLAAIALKEHFLERAKKYINYSFQIFEKESEKVGMVVALGVKGAIAASDEKHDLAIEFYQKNIAMNREMGNRLGIAGTLIALGNIEVMRGEIEKSQEYFQESLEIYRNSKDKSGEAGTLNAIGLADLYSSKIESSHQHFQQALRINRELHSYSGMSTALIALGEIARTAGNFSSAQQYYFEAAQITENLGQVGIAMIVSHNLGYVETQLGNHQEGLNYFRQSLELAYEREHHRFVYYCLMGIASVYVELERYTDAVKLFSSAEHLVRNTHYELDPVDQTAVDSGIKKLNEKFQTEEFRQAEITAEAMTLEEILKLAQS